MKRFVFFGTLSALAVVLFLVLRPAMSVFGSSAVPDTAGRAKELLPEELAGGTEAGTATVARKPRSVAGAPLDAIEQQIITLTNEQRTEAGLRPLVFDDSLRRAARSHGRDMIERSFEDPINPDGLSAEDRVARENRRAVAVVGENISSASANDAELARRIVADWLADPGKREKVLRPEYTEIGVGVVPSSTEIRAVQVLARTIALTDAPIPATVAARANVRIVPAPRSAANCTAVDVFSPGTGLAVLGPVPFGDIAMNVEPGVYRLRFHCTDGGSRIFTGPRFEVTR